MTGADEEQEEGEDLCAIDYARHYGLSTPFYDEQLLVGGLPTPPLDDFDQDPWDPSNALSTRATSVLIKERLTVNKDAALLLKAVHDFREVPQDETTPATPRQFARQLKQELPVLRTDNELDMLSFGNASAPDLTKLNIPSEMINNENDEGLEWPRKYLRYPAQCENQIKAEKLAVLSNALRYLQDAVCDSHVSEDFEKFKVESVGYTPVSEQTKRHKEALLIIIEYHTSTSHAAIVTTLSRDRTLRTFVPGEPPPTPIQQQ